jgi:3D (Asp-Asp-Asp) domain-containing protein
MTARHRGELAQNLAAQLDDPSDRQHDVSQETRVPKGRGRQSGEWTTEDSGTPSDQAMSARCPNGYDVVPMLVTGYSNGRESTGKGPGDPGYGITSHQTRAGYGTIAAASDYSFGTRMYVPGYGWGTVQDRGGNVKGHHIDLWFKTAAEAKKWGKRTVNVIVCRK